MLPKKVGNMEMESTNTSTVGGGEQSENKPLKIHQQIEEMLEAFCNDYCKYPEQYAREYGTDDAGMDKLWDEKCYLRPFMRW